jgi:two-component system nitrogen regulation sensor histidine kinase GlnL
VLDAVLDGVVVLDEEGRVEFVNVEACRILGTSNEAAAGKSLSRIIPPDHPLSNAVQSVLESGRACVESELRITRERDGDLLLEVAASPLFEGDRRRSGAVLALRDRTIQHSLQQKASERERLSAFGRIAAGIAHEVKNPLGGIRGAAEILASRAADTKTRDTAELIVREVARIASLVDEMMVFTRGEDVRFAPTNIHRVLDDVLEIVSMDSLGKGVEFVRHFDPSIPEIIADADRLVQVFLNLVRNALQALDGSGTLTIHSRVSPGQRLTLENGASVPMLLVVVEDDGPGMEPEILEQLSTPLFTTRNEGTGLGLAVARHWISRHEGTLNIDSAPGAGTRASVALPLRRPDGDERRPE